eukprot:sb/3469382/
MKYKNHKLDLDTLNDKDLAKIIEEINLCRLLDTSTLLSISDVSVDRSTLHYTTAPLTYGSCLDYIHCGGLEETVISSIITSVLCALEYLHSHQIVHRLVHVIVSWCPTRRHQSSGSPSKSHTVRKSHCVDWTRVCYPPTTAREVPHPTRQAGGSTSLGFTRVDTTAILHFFSTVHPPKSCAELFCAFITCYRIARATQIQNFVKFQFWGEQLKKNGRLTPQINLFKVVLKN